MTPVTSNALGGDASVHPSLFSQAEWIRGLAQRLVRDAAAANDLTQDALMEALRGSDGDQGRPWVTGVTQKLAKGERWLSLARPLARPWARRRRRRTEAVLEAVRVARYTPTKEETLLRAEAHQWLVGEVLALPDNVRSILLQCYFEGHSPEEIAKAEGTSLALVSAKIAESRAALRRRLDRGDGQSDEGTRWISSLAPLLTPSGEKPIAERRWRMGNFLKISLCIMATPGLIVFLVMVARTMSELSQAVRLLGVF